MLGFFECNDSGFLREQKRKFISVATNRRCFNLGGHFESRKSLTSASFQSDSGGALGSAGTPVRRESTSKDVVAWFSSSMAASRESRINTGGALFAMSEIVKAAKDAIEACSPLARDVHSDTRSVVVEEDNSKSWPAQLVSVVVQHKGYSIGAAVWSKRLVN